ncbi:hypothetical protein B0H10DRAFT_1969248 [Mycena sp. CBHHK59/15]|nr:hypothetical protein B0H10DRAFT_1969248 [Mycena sp. CBHHK59/15]
MTHHAALAGSKLRAHTTQHGAAQTRPTPAVPRQREHLFEDEVVWAEVREGGTEGQARTGSSSFARHVRGWRKSGVSGRSGGLAPVSRAADTPSLQASSKPVRHSRESILMQLRAHGNHL